MSQGVWCSPSIIVHVCVGPSSGHSRVSLSMYRHAVHVYIYTFAHMYNTSSFYNHEILRSALIYLSIGQNKAVHTATTVAGGWAGAVMS